MRTDGMVTYVMEGREVKTLMCRVVRWGLHRVMVWMRVSSDVRESVH